MNKFKWWRSLAALIVVAAVVLSGCTDSKSPKERLEASLAKSSDIKSYSFKGSLQIEDLTIPQDIAASEQDAAGALMAANMLKNAELSWTGSYRADPMLMDMNLTLAIKGDMAITFTVPIVMNEKKIWIKIPNIPMLPIPEDVVDKYLELDLEQLAKESGQQMPQIDLDTSKKFVNDVSGIVFNNVDEKQYLSAVSVKDAGLPDDAGIDEAIQLHVTKDQLQPFLLTVVNKIAPEVIDLLSKNEEYRNMFGLKQEDLDAAKKQLADAQKGTLSKDLEEMKKALKSMDLKANIGMDKDDYPVYTDMNLQAGFEENGQPGSIGLKVVSQQSDINKEVKFANGEPDPKNIITIQQLQEKMGGLMGSGIESQSSAGTAN